MNEPESSAAAEDVPLPGGNFQLLVQKFGYQALIGLGVLENPLTKEQRADLPQAKMVIDDLMMLREKTQGNLDGDEEAHLGKVIGDLQGHYVRASEAEKAG